MEREDMGFWARVKATWDKWLDNVSNRSVETGPENERGSDWLSNDGIDYIIKPILNWYRHTNPSDKGKIK